MANEFKNTKAFKILNKNSKVLAIVIIPLVFMFIPIFMQSKAAYFAFVMLVMFTYWITECLPTPITSIMPVVLFPLFQIASSKCVSQIYLNDIQMLFWGDPRLLLLSTMSVTAFISCWMKNAAVTSMMFPIVQGLVYQIAKFEEVRCVEELKSSSVTNETRIQLSVTKEKRCLDSHQHFNRENNAYESDCEDSGKESRMTDITPTGDSEEESVEEDKLPDTKEARNLMVAFLLSISYASSIGGNGTLVGGAPNIVFKGYFEAHYKDGGLNFISYLAFGMPFTILMVFFSWIALCLMWLPTKELCFFKRSKPNSSLKLAMIKQYNDLGPYNWEQISAGCLFLTLVTLWLTRDLFVVPGWGYLFGGKLYVSDATPVIFIVIMMFIWPRENIFKGKEYKHLLSWSDLKKFPWDVLLLGGGSLAIAYGFEKSELSIYFGDLLATVTPAKKELGLIMIILFNQIGTEFTSNVSMIAIFLPIADRLAFDHRVNPVYYLVPLPACTSFSFMLPIGTTSNAIVMSSGHIKLKDMILTGLVVKIIGFLLLYLAANMWLLPVFPVDVGNNLFNGTLTQNMTKMAYEC